MNRVVDKVKEVKNKIVESAQHHESANNAEGRNMFKKKSQPDVQPGSSHALQQQGKHSWAKHHFLNRKAGHRRSASADTTVRALVKQNSVFCALALRLQSTATAAALSLYTHGCERF
eukprot:447481-Pelagomonas_calceolata.AAC.13